MIEWYKLDSSKELPDLKHQSLIDCNRDATCSRPIALQLTGDRWDRNAHIRNVYDRRLICEWSVNDRWLVATERLLVGD